MPVGSSNVVAPTTLGAFLFVAAYLNLNDPDWLLWSTAYSLGGLICLWTALRGATAAAENTGEDVSRTRRRVAMIYGAACLGLAGYSAFLAPRADSSETTGAAEGVILTFLSSEVAREAGGALIMVQAMALCAYSGRPSGGKPAAASAGVTVGETMVGALSVAVAVASIALGMLLPGYLQRAGIAVPAHCGGE